MSFNFRSAIPYKVSYMDVHNSKHNSPTLEAAKVYVPMSHPHKEQIPIKSEFSKERLQSLLVSVLKSIASYL